MTKIEKILGAQNTKPQTVFVDSVEGKKVSIEVKPFISAHEMAQFVEEVVESLFVSDNGTVNYMPVYREVAVTNSVLRHYTNLNPDVEIETLMQFNRTGAYEEILKNIDNKQLESILDAIFEAVDFRQREILSSQQAALERNLAMLEQNLQQIQHLTSYFEQLGKQFEGVNLQDITEDIKKIASKDEKAIVESIIDLQAEKTTPVENEIEGQIGFANPMGDDENV